MQQDKVWLLHTILKEEKTMHQFYKTFVQTAVPNIHILLQGLIDNKRQQHIRNHQVAKEEAKYHLHVCHIRFHHSGTETRLHQK